MPELGKVKSGYIEEKSLKPMMGMEMVFVKQ
jgi:hypothetical protein